MKVSLVTRYNGNPSFFALCQLGKYSQKLLIVVWPISVQDQNKTKHYQYQTACGPHYISFIRNYNASISQQVYFISPDFYHNKAKIPRNLYMCIDPYLFYQTKKTCTNIWQKIQLMKIYRWIKIHIDLTTFGWDTHEFNYWVSIL